MESNIFFHYPEKSLMNCWFKLTNSRQPLSSLTIFGFSQYQTACVLLESIRIPWIPTMYLRKSTSVLLNWHFSGLRSSFAFCRQHKTSSTCSACFWLRIRVYENVVLVDNCCLVKVCTDRVVDSCLTSCWRICRTKWHDYILIVSVFNPKHCLVFFAACHANKVVCAA